MSAAKFVVPLIIVGVLGIVVYNMVTWDESVRKSGCPGHWHTSFDVYVEGDKAAFPKPPYTLNSPSEGGKLPLKMHMHKSDPGNFIHYEPSTASECQGIAQTFDYLDIDVNERSLVFEAGSNHGPVQPGTYAVNDTHKLRGFVHYANTKATTIQGQVYDVFESYRDWEELSMDKVLDIKQLPDFSQLLIVYGDEDDATIQNWQNSVAATPGTR